MNKYLISLMVLMSGTALAQVSTNPGVGGSFALKSNGVYPGSSASGLTIFEVDNAGVVRRNNLVKLDDEFLGTTLGSVWTATAGNTAVTPSLIVSDSGILSMTTVASAATASGTQSVAGPTAWKANKGDLIMETRLLLDSSSTQAVFAGFVGTSSYIAGGPVGVSRTSVSALTTTSNTANFAGIVFDASTTLAANVTTTQPTFRMGGNKDSISTTMADTGVSVAPSTWYTLRAALNTSGTLCTTVNEVPKGCTQNAISATTALTPVVYVTNRAGVVHNLNVDYIQVQQKR